VEFLGQILPVTKIFNELHWYFEEQKDDLNVQNMIEQHCSENEERRFFPEKETENVLRVIRNDFATPKNIGLGKQNLKKCTYLRKNSTYNGQKTQKGESSVSSRKIPTEEMRSMSRERLAKASWQKKNVVSKILNQNLKWGAATHNQSTSNLDLTQKSQTQVKSNCRYKQKEGKEGPLTARQSVGTNFLKEEKDLQSTMGEKKDPSDKKVVKPSVFVKNGSSTINSSLSTMERKPGMEVQNIQLYSSSSTLSNASKAKAKLFQKQPKTGKEVTKVEQKRASKSPISRQTHQQPCLSTSSSKLHESVSMKHINMSYVQRAKIYLHNESLGGTQNSQIKQNEALGHQKSIIRESEKESVDEELSIYGKVLNGTS